MLVNLAWKSFQFLAGLVTPADETYYKYARFSGTKGPINCLTFSHGGELLACGSDDERVHIWEIATRKCLQILEDPGKRWGQVTCMSWLANLGNDDLKPIAFGTGRGLIIIYRRPRVDAGMVELASNRVFDASDPVESMSFDARKSYLAITSHHGRIALYDIGRNGTMMELWSVKSDADKKVCIPRSIQFYDGGRKVLIFILETGEMICRDVETSREEWRKVLKSGIGHTSIYAGKQLLVDNLSTGFDVYDLPRSSPSYAFTIPNKRKCVKDGAFTEQASAIVCGSDHGKIYVFSTASSVPVQVLTAARKTVEVQAIGAATTAEAHFIASGTSTEMSEVTIWEKPIKRAKNRIETDSVNRTLIVLMNLLLILVLLHWTSNFWTPIASKVTNRTIQAMSQMAEQTAVVGMQDERSTQDERSVQNEKPNFTEWTVESRFQPGYDDDEGRDDDSYQYNERISWDEL